MRQEIWTLNWFLKMILIIQSDTCSKVDASLYDSERDYIPLSLLCTTNCYTGKNGVTKWLKKSLQIYGSYQT